MNVVCAVCVEVRVGVCSGCVSVCVCVLRVGVWRVVCMLRLETSPWVRAKLPRVCLQNTRVLDTYVCFCRHARDRFEHTHGDADKHGTRLPLFLLPSRPTSPTRYAMACQPFFQSLFRYCTTTQRGTKKDAQKQSSALQRLDQGQTT